MLLRRSLVCREGGGAPVAYGIHQIGPVVTLGWLHHGLSPLAREEASTTLAPGLRSDGTFAEWMAQVWLRTAGLGAGWTNWRR